MSKGRLRRLATGGRRAGSGCMATMHLLMATACRPPPVRSGDVSVGSFTWASGHTVIPLKVCLAMCVDRAVPPGGEVVVLLHKAACAAAVDGPLSVPHTVGAGSFVTTTVAHVS
jgi:hypothetical protein